MSTYQLVPINQPLSKSFLFVSASQSSDYSESYKSFVESSSNMALTGDHRILTLWTSSTWMRAIRWEGRKPILVLAPEFFCYIAGSTAATKPSDMSVNVKQRHLQLPIGCSVRCFPNVLDWYIIQSEQKERRRLKFVVQTISRGRQLIDALYLSLPSPFLFCVIF